MNVSIVIPAYNEEKGILGTIDGVVEAIKPLSIEYELIVVNDEVRRVGWEALTEKLGIELS